MEGSSAFRVPPIVLRARCRNGVLPVLIYQELEVEEFLLLVRGLEKCRSVDAVWATIEEFVDIDNVRLLIDGKIVPSPPPRKAA